MSDLWVFVMLWGVWLIVPILVDGFDSLGRLVAVKRDRARRTGEDQVPDDALPRLTIIVPCHNEAAVIDRCLTSVKAQRYPHDRLEVIVIDDGSTDGTADVAEAHGAEQLEITIRGEHIRVGPFEGRFLVIRNDHAGKAHALNTGIAASTGEIVVNIDSDVVLAPESARAIAEAFARDASMGAATGNIEIDWELVEERDEDGHVVAGEDGLPLSKDLTLGERLLAKCQFLEYLSSFRLGRHAQASRNAMFSLAGACSAFRRRDVQSFFEYSNRTVSEDTDLTWQLHRKGVRVGFIPGARTLLEPLTAWDPLYAQRVRWARGQLEVSALNAQEARGRRRAGGGATLANTLQFDHTLAFTRFVWTPLMLFFPLLGYSPKLLAIVFLGMYVFYVAIEVVNTLAIFQVAEDDTKARIERCTGAIAILPAYRFVVFYFRFAGFLVALREKQQWTRPAGSGEWRGRLDVARLRSVRAGNALANSLSFGWSWMLSAVLLAAGLLGGTAIYERIAMLLRREG